MQKILSSTIQMAAVIIPITGCFLGLPTGAENLQLVSNNNGGRNFPVVLGAIKNNGKGKEFNIQTPFPKPKSVPGIKGLVSKIEIKYSVDCKTKNYREISRSFYDNKGVVITTKPSQDKLNPVKPNTAVAKQVESVCKNTTPKPTPTATPTPTPTPPGTGKTPNPPGTGKKPNPPGTGKKPNLSTIGWQTKVQKFIKQFKKEANQVQDSTVGKALQKKANTTAGQRELVQIAQATCAFAKSGRPMDELKKRHTKFILQQDPGVQKLLKSQYAIVTKVSGNICPEVADLMKY